MTRRALLALSLACLSAACVVAVLWWVGATPERVAACLLALGAASVVTVALSYLAEGRL